MITRIQVNYMLPIIADADTGHGGLTAVMKVVTIFLDFFDFFSRIFDIGENHDNDVFLYTVYNVTSFVLNFQHGPSSLIENSPV